jgi:hypothetical protein
MAWIVMVVAIIGMLWMIWMSKKQITLAYKRGYEDAINSMEIAALIARNEQGNNK